MGVKSRDVPREPVQVYFNLHSPDVRDRQQLALDSTGPSRLQRNRRDFSALAFSGGRCSVLLLACSPWSVENVGGAKLSTEELVLI